MDEFEVPSWDMDKKTEAMVDNIFSNMAILSAKKDKLSKQAAGSGSVKTKKKKKKKRKQTSTNATAKPNNSEQTAGNDSIQTKSEKRKRKKRKAAVKPNDPVAEQSACTEANVSAVTNADESGEGVMLGAEVSQKKKRKKKKSTCKKNKYAHLGRKGVSENLCTVDPSATKNLKTCVEPAIGAMADKNISMTNDDKSGKNEKQMFPEKSGVNIVDESVKSPGKKRKFCEIEESLSKSNCGEREKEGGTVKKRKLSKQDEGSPTLPKNKLVKESGLKKKQKISVGKGVVQNAAQVEMGSVKKQQASNAIDDRQKSVKIGSVKKIQVSENKVGIQKPKQKKKLQKKNDKDLSSDVVREEKSSSKEITPHKKDSVRKLPFNINKLRAALAAAKTPSQPEEVAKPKSRVRKAADDSDTVEKKDEKEKAEPSLRESMMARLSAARFRLINEELYTSTSKDAVELFKTDKESFKVYHEGYQSQVAKWPTVPVDKMVQYIKSRSSGLVVADFGCGDAKIARSVPNKVHSFDLVALNKHVIVCDMKRVPLSKASVDIAVFCLSLMGTNLVEFLCEANRVLKLGGILLIAEVVSRFDKVSVFVKKLQKLGFTLVEKDQSNTMFVWFEFKKRDNRQMQQNYRQLN